MINLLRLFATKKVAEHDRRAMEHIRALMTCILWEYGDCDDDCPSCYQEARKFTGFVIERWGIDD